MSKIVTKMAWRNIFRNKRRTLLTLLAITLGMWSCIALASFARGASTQLARDAIHILTGHLQIHAPGYLKDPAIEHSMDLPLEQIEDLAKSTEITKWTRRVRVPGVLVSERESYGITIVGIEQEREAKISFVGDAPLEGKPLESGDKSGIVIGKKLAEILQTRIGRRVVLMAEDANGKIADRGFIIKGIFDEDLEVNERAFAFISLETAQEMLALGSRISEVSILGNDRDNIDRLESFVKERLPNLEVTNWRDISPLVVSVLKMQDGILQFWFFVVVIIISFGVMNTIFMAIFERLREIGVMQAVGMKPVLVIKLIVVESLLLILIGGSIGNISSYITVWLLQDGIDISQFAKGAEMMGIRHRIYPVILLRDLIAANIIILIVGILSSLYPAWKASRYRPMEALRGV